MKKILLFSSSLSYGGAEYQMYNIFKTLSIEFDTKIVVAKNSEFKDDEILILNKKKTFWALINFYKIIIKEKPQIVISTLPIPNLMSSISKLLVKNKLIVINREANYNLDSLFNKIVFIISSKLTDIHFFNSEKVMKIYSKKYKKISHKFVTINNILDDDFQNYIKNLEKNKSQDDGFVHAVVIARLEKNKGIDVLVNALNNLKDEKIKLDIIGSGSQEFVLKKLAKNNNINFLGHVSNPVKMLVNYDVFILPSRKEGMSNSLLHALALNKISIVSDCVGGSEELITKYSPNSYVFKNEDVSNLTKVIKKVLKTKNFNSKVNDKFYEDFSETKFLYNFNNVINKI